MVSAKVEPFSDSKEIFSSDFKNVCLNINHPQIRAGDKYDQITRVFQPTIRFLQFIGFVPLIIKEYEGSVHFEVKAASHMFIYTWASISVQTFIHAIFILNRELHIDWPIQIFRRPLEADLLFTIEETVNANSSLKKLEEAFIVFLPAAAIVTSALARFHYKQLQTFMNNWITFSKDYKRLFIHVHKIEFKVYASKTLFAFVGLSLMSLYFLSPLTSKLLISENVIFNSIVSAGYVIIVVGPWCFTGMFSGIALRVFIGVYREIRFGIESQYETMSQDVTYDQVKCWIRLVIQVRNQIEVFEKYCGWSELADLLSTFITVLGSSYLAFSVLLNGDQGDTSLLTMAATMTLFGLYRVYFKGRFSEMVTEEESQIANLVMRLKANDFDSRARLQMKILCDMILNKPVQITFGKLIVLNTKLVLSILTQLAAYLVVFLQFKP